jgi:integrase/recombinase XerC
VFLTDSGLPIYQTWINRMFNRYRDAAGVGAEWTPHTFRHRFCTTLLEKNVDLRDSMRLTGHKDVRNLMIYSEVTRSRAATNIEVIGDPVVSEATV